MLPIYPDLIMKTRIAKASRCRRKYIMNKKLGMLDCHQKALIQFDFQYKLHSSSISDDTKLSALTSEEHRVNGNSANLL